MLKIQYRDAKDGGIEVLRCFSKEDQVEIPSEIEGKRVTKIGDYAFSAHKRKEDEAKEIMIGEDFLGSEDEPMFCGEAVKEETGLFGLSLLRVSKKWRCRRHCCHSIVAGTTAVVPARFVSHLRVANRLRRLCPLGDGELFKFYLKSSVCQRQTGLPKGNPPCAFPAVPAGVLGRREGAGIQWMQLPKAVSD